jgi:hypothetical protein
MAALNQFNLDDLEIIESEEIFKTNKQSLENELQRAQSGNPKKHTIDKVDLF